MLMPCLLASLTLPAGLLVFAVQSEVAAVLLEASLMVLSGRSFFSFAGTLEADLNNRHKASKKHNSRPSVKKCC